MLISVLFFCLACNTVPANWHICVDQGLTFLHDYGFCLSEEKGSCSRGTLSTDCRNMTPALRLIGHTLGNSATAVKKHRQHLGLGILIELKIR